MVADHRLLGGSEALGVEGAADEFGLAALDRLRRLSARLAVTDCVDLVPQLVGGLLELRHPVAAERVGVGQALRTSVSLPAGR